MFSFTTKTNTNTKNNIAQFFLPSLRHYDTNKTIIDTFHNMAIGEVIDIDMKDKATNKYAFLKIRLYNTDYSIQFMDKIMSKGYTRLPIERFGRRKFSWLVKDYITREYRNLYNCDISAITSSNDEEFSFYCCDDNDNTNILESSRIPIVPRPSSSAFTKKDIDDMNREFEDLENLIFTKKVLL